MNIFFLDVDPQKAAEYHCDKHVVKMIMETAQMVSTVYSKNNAHQSWMLKPCFHNHPCTLWAGYSLQNLIWLVSLGLALVGQYTQRYEKEHKYTDLMFNFGVRRHFFLPDLGLTEPALAMPEDCRIGDAVESYRQYYKTYKRSFATWKNQTPQWFT